MVSGRAGTARRAGYRERLSGSDRKVSAFTELRLGTGSDRPAPEKSSTWSVALRATGTESRASAAVTGPIWVSLMVWLSAPCHWIFAGSFSRVLVKRIWDRR